MDSENNKPIILIVDDSDTNRAELSDLLKDNYEIWEASDAEEAVSIISRNLYKISLILLDIIMPGMDGFDVLSIMNKNQWIEKIPVIIILEEFKSDYIEKTCEMGVTDYIRKPYDSFLIHHRIKNTLSLYDKQKKLKYLLEEQIYEKEKNSRMMISILAHIVEFRNGESGLHVIHIQTVTKLLLKALAKKTDKYHLTEKDILSITTASSLHDIGKITIDDKILNKPGKLTDEEFAIMKTHSMAGAGMLKDLPIFQEKTLMGTAYEICRWHHERYDGKGYPDGLKGDEIPISAQVVSLADVYDALTSERCYKKAFPHETAMQMILNGECGTFNPLVLECLKENEDIIKESVQENTFNEIDKNLLQKIAEEIVEHGVDAPSIEHTNHEKLEREKVSFYTSNIEEIQFDYDANLDTVSISPYAARILGLNEVIKHPHRKNQDFIGKDNVLNLVKSIQEETSVENPEIKKRYFLELDGKKKEYEVHLRTLWSTDKEPKYLGVVGRIVEVKQ